MPYVLNPLNLMHHEGGTVYYSTSQIRKLKVRKTGLRSHSSNIVKLAAQVSWHLCLTQHDFKLLFNLFSFKVQHLLISILTPMPWEMLPGNMQFSRKKEQ